MKYRQLGKWGARLSVVGIGSYLTIGFKCDEETSRQMVRVAYENGVNFFDTANAYNRGGAEEMLGRCLSAYRRSSLFVLTKVFAPMDDGPNDRGLSAKHIKEQCEASLKRLQMLIPRRRWKRRFGLWRTLRARARSSTGAPQSGRLG